MLGKWRVVTDKKYGAPLDDPEGGCHCGIDCNRCAYSECPLDELEIGTRIGTNDWNQSLPPGATGEVAGIDVRDGRKFSIRLPDGSMHELSEREMLSVDVIAVGE